MDILRATGLFIAFLFVSGLVGASAFVTYMFVDGIRKHEPKQFIFICGIMTLLTMALTVTGIVGFIGAF